ncbi:MAG: Holliday junction branch migration protein RuvA [Fimbriimonadales bacterium]|jgi:Holliday junction DNA helicase RuvA|nr:Holliday junction branch migration protein RuvA [Armatimonadota bacterium]MCX7687450.1 Holliday junction branch migration protein RuvA [Fimbriimonadales bacterium]CUU09501.1 Holliday junction DNA helicase subunit RuvA [Armatimonadetes bacterium GBS]CUU35119.1 Holliday junction DNA helicase subunit RuvA [Armatimonadetes bacterium GXS]CUU37175.1 Holliday junction DNA helicase subunit RuvA [Armatimonadetes bacterium DC]GBC91114.1 Holliday junction ATP-dependent DNA helicase RuvA [bacterium HR1
MIGRLTGYLVGFEGDTLLLDVHGVGYEVRVPQSVRTQLPPLGEMITLHVRTLFSEEEGLMLFGFTELAQRRLFDLLLRVSGVGPKMAMNLLSAAEPEVLARAIARKDTRYLRSLPGVGAKLAERMVLELADKVAEFAFERQIERLEAASRTSQIDLDALAEGLVQLGYSRRDALNTLTNLLNENPSADETTLMRLALTRLGLKR